MKEKSTENATNMWNGGFSPEARGKPASDISSTPTSRASFLFWPLDFVYILNFAPERLKLSLKLRLKKYEITESPQSGP